jgi:hypothetical protein
VENVTLKIEASDGGLRLCVGETFDMTTNSVREVVFKDELEEFANLPTAEDILNEVDGGIWPSFETIVQYDHEFDGGTW